MLLFIILTLLISVCGFIAGYYTGRIKGSFIRKKEQLIQKIDYFITSIFSSYQFVINFHDFYASLLKLLEELKLFEFVLIKHTSGQYINLNSNTPVSDPLIIQIFAQFQQEVTKQKKAILQNTTEFNDSSPLMKLQVNTENKHHYNQGSLYLSSFQLINTDYYFVFFYDKKKLTAETEHFCHFLQKQIFLILSFYELSGSYDTNTRFIRSIFDENPLMMCLTDHNGTIFQANLEFSRFFSHSPESPFIITEFIDNASMRALLNGSHLEKDIPFKHKNLKIVGIPLPMMDRPENGSLIIIQDFTVQNILYKKLEESEERYKKFLKELPLGLLIINDHGTIHFVNDYFMISLGFNENQQVLGSNINDFFDIPDNNFETIARQIESHDYLYFKFQLKSNFGSRIFSVHLQKIVLEDEELIEATLQDISLENKLYSQLEEKTKLIEEELSTARKIWDHILSIPPIYSSLIRFETFFKPSYQLGGDFFDIIQIDDIHLGVIIADASGHGVSASLITSMLKMAVEFAPKDPHRLDDMVHYLNSVLMKVLLEDQYITLFFGIIDTKNFSIEYINCGHPFPLVFNEKEGTTEVLKGTTFPLGIKMNISYSDSIQKKQLPVNCKLLFYTDGLLSFKKKGKILKTDDLIEIFEKSAESRTKDILRNVYIKVLSNSTQFTDDDVSMLLLLINKDLSFKKYLSIPSNVLEIDNAIVKLSESISKITPLEEDDKWKLYTALYEAIINAVEHGNKFGIQKRVTIIYRIYKNWIVFKVRDEGVGFNVGKVPDPLENDNLLKPSGRGVFMIRKIMNKVKYNKTGNEVTMYLELKDKKSS